MTSNILILVLLHIYLTITMRIMNEDTKHAKNVKQPKKENKTIA